MTNERESMLVTIKICGLFVFLILLWIVNLLIPSTRNLDIQGFNIYEFRLMILFYILVIAFSTHIIVIKRKFINNSHIMAGIILGTIANFHRLDSIIFLTTALSYIASLLIFLDSEVKMIFFKKPTRKKLIIVTSFFTILLILYYFYYGALAILHSFIKALAPGVLEEVIFRMFLFAVSVYIMKGKLYYYNRNKIIVYLIMIIPFTIYHFASQAIEFGAMGLFLGILGIAMPFAISPIFTMYIISIILTRVAIKHDLISAIMIHIFINFIGFIAHSSIENIWQYSVPSMIQMIFMLL